MKTNFHSVWQQRKASEREGGPRVGIQNAKSHQKAPNWNQIPLILLTRGTVVQILHSTASFGSRTQGTIVLSSGEAELYAIGQGTSEALYIRNLITEAKLAKSININIHTDSAAGKSMATRFGTSKKTKPVELRFLYVQELVGKGLIKLRKIGTKDNCADVLTKYLGTELLRPHLKNPVCVQPH